VPEAIDVLSRASRVAGGGDGAATAAAPSRADATLGERQLWMARAEIALVEQRPQVALQIVDARLAAERAANPGSSLGVPRLSLLKGEALTMLERYEEAERALEMARDDATRQGTRPTIWRAEAALGHVHRLQRKRLEARRAFDAARSIADDLAAKVPDATLRDHFSAGLDALIPAAPAPSSGRAMKEALGGLTQRERDVTALVAQGKANRAIARQLGIGERTVEGYVASALGKLGFASRAQLAAWAVEKGLTIPPASRSP
jgi:DNA-binding CsgD family transcriptional regulator